MVRGVRLRPPRLADRDTRGSSGPDYDEYLITPCAPGSPCSGSFTDFRPDRLAVAPDGSIWFTNQLRNELGRLDVANGTFTAYSLLAVDRNFTGGPPRAISAAPDGTLWLAQYGGYGRPARHRDRADRPRPPGCAESGRLPARRRTLPARGHRRHARQRLVHGLDRRRAGEDRAARRRRRGRHARPGSRTRRWRRRRDRSGGGGGGVGRVA